MSIQLIYSIIFCLSLLFPDLKVQGKTSATHEYCAFCDTTVLEKQKFYEDDLVAVLYTHKPICPGHCLIIPKRHIQRFENLSNEEADQLMRTIKKVHQAINTTFHTSSYLLLQKNGIEAGQTVPHVHFHYIPRENGATSTLAFMFKMYMANLKKPIDAPNMQNMVSKLREAMTSQKYPVW